MHGVEARIILKYDKNKWLEHIEKGIPPKCEMLVKQEELLKELKNESVIK